MRRAPGRSLWRTAAGLCALGVVACHTSGPAARSAPEFPVPAPDSIPTALRNRNTSDPPLEYVLVAFEDTVPASSRARILAGIEGVVEGGLDMGPGLPRSYIVRVPPARDRAALAEITRRLRELQGVFAAGMWPLGISG